jgi:hypothetical protein
VVCVLCVLCVLCVGGFFLYLRVFCTGFIVSNVNFLIQRCTFSLRSICCIRVRLGLRPVLFSRCTFHAFYAFYALGFIFRNRAPIIGGPCKRHAVTQLARHVYAHYVFIPTFIHTRMLFSEKNLQKAYTNIQMHTRTYTPLLNIANRNQPVVKKRSFLTSLRDTTLSDKRITIRPFCTVTSYFLLFKVNSTSKIANGVVRFYDMCMLPVLALWMVKSLRYI